MVGRPTLPDSGEQRPELRGAAAAPTPGLTALDEEREASMADEGGWSGAIVEAEDPLLAEELACGVTGVPARRVAPALVLGAAAGLALGVWLYRRRGDM
jgi:hypothetical protein